MIFKLQKRLFTLGEIGFNFKLREKLKGYILSDRLGGLVPKTGDSGLSKRVDNYDKLYTVFAD